MNVTEALLSTWFGHWSDDEPMPDGGPPQYRIWWMKSDETDAMLRAKFADANAAAKRGELDHWCDTPGGTLALVLLLDQISRNIHRNTADMFAGDAAARTVVHRAIRLGLDQQMAPIHRYFLYMPLMHSEGLADHELATERFETLAAETSSLERSSCYRGAADYEQKHRAIVERFGRYPHRNTLLGRESTPEEEAFLTEAGSSF